MRFSSATCRGDDPSVIRFGILGAPESVIGPAGCPAWVQAIMKSALPATIPDDLRIEREVIARLDECARGRGTSRGVKQGLKVAVHAQHFTGRRPAGLPCIARMK